MMACFLCFCGRFVSNVSVERDAPTSRKTFTMPVGAGLAPPANSAPQEENVFVGREPMAARRAANGFA